MGAIPDSPSADIRQKLHLAIVGCGRACKFFIEHLETSDFPYVDIQIVGVCDIDPDAQGMIAARKKGIFTTSDFRDLFHLEKLDSIMELTGHRHVLLQLIQQCPAGVGVVDHNISRLMRSLFFAGHRLQAIEQELLGQKKSSDFLIRHSNAAIVVLNTDFMVMEANECYLRMVNKTKAEVIGAYCYKVHRGFEAPCPHAVPSLSCPMMETLRTGKSAHVIQEFSRSGVESTYDNIVTYPLKDSNGRILRIIEIWRDITKEIASRWETRVKQIHADMNHLVQEDRMISLGKLVASCVHEINNPIQGMMMFTGLMQEMLQKGTFCSDDRVQFYHFLSLMDTELERCGNIVSGLLSFSRQAPNEFRDTDLNEVMGAVLMLTKHKMEMMNIHCELDLPEKPLIINGDSNRLQQCLLNLVFNAIEAMPYGGRLHMANRRLSFKKMATIEIEDSGEGIEEKNMDHLFDPFFTTKEEGQGTGLGLSIVHGVVKMHRGNIQVKSRPGVGSKFTIQFPLVKS